MILKLKKQFYYYKTPTLFEGVDIEKALVPNKISFREKNYKYFTGYVYDNHKVKPLHIMFPKTSTYVKSYDRQTKWIFFD